MDVFTGIKRDEKRCTGCKACEAACSLKSNAAYDLQRSNVVGNQFEGEVIFPICRHCEKPECLLVCLVGAIERDERGRVRLADERCIGCGICSTVCPYGGIRLLPSRVSKCDLCDGQPLCVALVLAFPILATWLKGS
jgi:anaerobic carbon-monoxide dehydrogenase iron sulfur subunit